MTTAETVGVILGGLTCVGGIIAFIASFIKSNERAHGAIMLALADKESVLVEKMSAKIAERDEAIFTRVEEGHSKTLAHFRDMLTAHEATERAQMEAALAEVTSRAAANLADARASTAAALADVNARGTDYSRRIQEDLARHDARLTKAQTRLDEVEQRVEHIEARVDFCAKCLEETAKKPKKRARK